MTICPIRGQCSSRRPASTSSSAFWTSIFRRSIRCDALFLDDVGERPQPALERLAAEALFEEVLGEAHQLAHPLHAGLALLLHHPAEDLLLLLLVGVEGGHARAAGVEGELGRALAVGDPDVEQPGLVPIHAVERRVPAQLLEQRRRRLEGVDLRVPGRPGGRRAGRSRCWPRRRRCRRRRGVRSPWRR